jgi:RNA polymerase sigma-70 factor, ECF subfamily
MMVSIHCLQLWSVVDNLQPQTNQAQANAMADPDIRAAALVDRVARGDGDALVALYDEYGRLAFSLAYRILQDATSAEEVVQDAFERVWNNAANFNTSRGKVRTWLMSIVHNRSIDLVRSRQRRRETPLDDAPVDRQHSEPDVSTAVLQILTGEEVRTAVRQLPPEQQQAIELAYFGGLTQHEVAERTGTPLGTVKSRMRLGLRHLHTMLATGGRTDGE